MVSLPIFILLPQRGSRPSISPLKKTCCSIQWIGLRENLQETIDFPIKLMGLKPVNFPLNQSIDLFIWNVFE